MMQRYFYSIARTLLQGGFPIAINFVLGNVLSVSEYGKYVALLLLATTVAILAAMPVDSATIHYILKSKDQTEQNCYYSAGTIIVLVNVVLVFLVLILGKPMFESWLKLGILNLPTYASVILVSIATVVYSFYAKMMTVRFLFKEQIIVLLLSAIAQGCAIVYLIQTKTASPANFLNTSLLFYAIGIVLYEYRLRKEFNYTNKITKRIHIKPLAGFGSLIYLGALTGFLDEKIDLFCINYMLDKEQLAYYSYAMLFGFVLYGVGLGVSQVTFPLFCQYLHKNDLANCELTYHRTLNFLFLIISFAGLALLYNGHFIIQLLLPDDYLSMLPALSIIIPGITMFAVFAGVGSLLTAAGKPQYGLWLLASFMVVNLILNTVLIPLWGIIGAAIATSTTFLARSLVIHWLNKKITGMRCQIGRLLYWYCIMIFLAMKGLSLNIVTREIILLSFLFFAGWSLVSSKDRRWLRAILTRTPQHKVE